MKFSKWIDIFGTQTFDPTEKWVKIKKMKN